MSIEQLNTEFSIAGSVQFVAGEGGLPFITVQNQSAKAVISVYAGQVLSFQPTNEAEDLLFKSAKAYYQDGKAIKGGVPICWPWFGPDPEGQNRPSHGFVRNRAWNVVSTTALSDAETQVVLGLVDTEETRAIWPQFFELKLEITVGKTLKLEMVTRNTGNQPFMLTQALHTYFRIGHIDQVQVLGLEDTHYLDKTDGGAEKVQDGVVAIAKEVDYVYKNVAGELVIVDAALARRIRITSSGSQTAIVWNPWAENSVKMADLDDLDYQKFICVETANAANEIIAVQPQREYRISAIYEIERD